MTEKNTSVTAVIFTHIEAVLGLRNPLVHFSLFNLVSPSKFFTGIPSNTRSEDLSNLSNADLQSRGAPVMTQFMEKIDLISFYSATVFLVTWQFNIVIM